MDRKPPRRDPIKWDKLLRHAEHSKGLLGALAGYAFHRYRSDKRTALWIELTKLYGKDPVKVTAEEFLCPELIHAFATLAGKDLAGKLPRIVTLRLEGQFSDAPGRRSYRSSHFVFYAEWVIALICSLIRMSCDRETLKERLFCVQAENSVEYLLALELHDNNPEFVALLHEAMMGDNSQILLTREMINAIVISGHDGLLEDLMKLLLAARLQEGLRQQILEAADKGSARVLSRIIKVCLDADLFRYSSAIRAFDTWTGMGYGDEKPATVRKYAQYAWECLNDEAKRQAYYDSPNNAETYFALWAQGCHELMTVYEFLPQLLASSRQDRKVLGWMFIFQTGNSYYQMRLAARHLEEQDEELLAWVTRNLSQTWHFSGCNWRMAGVVSGTAVPNADFPEEKAERAALFHRLRETAAYIGNKKRTFSGSPFPFVSITLEAGPVYGCMLSLAGYDMDETLVAELLELAPNMTVDQRLTIIRMFLLPDRSAAHRAFLRDCLGDRSLTVKEQAVERLGECALGLPELEDLAQTLRSKSSDLRAGILKVLKKQDPELLRLLIPQMLDASEENQNQAAIELLAELNELHPEILSANHTGLNRLRAKKLSTQTQILLDQLLATKPEETALSPDNGYGCYDPAVIQAYLTSASAMFPKPGFLSPIFGSSDDLYAAWQIKALIPTQEELDRLADRMHQVFVRHADAEIEVEAFDGSRHKILFGDQQYHLALPASCGHRLLSEPGARLDMVPFWDEFREALGEYGKDIKKILGVFFLTARILEPHHPFSTAVPSPWYLPIAALNLVPASINGNHSQNRKAMLVLDILNRLPSLPDPHQVFAEAVKIYRSMLAIWGKENLGKAYMKINADPRFIVYGSRLEPIGINHRMLAVWRRAIHQLELNSEDFAAWFALEYSLEQPIQGPVTESLTTTEYFRACHENRIPRDILAAYLLDDRNGMPGKIKVLTNPTRWPEGRLIYERYPFARTFVDGILDRIVTVEEKRGELRTPLTGHCIALERFEGAAHFCNLLAALGKETFFRGYEFSQNDTKKAVLSRLLKRCYPAKEDTPERLAALLQATDISQNRLVEAAMYAPQWAGFAEEILGWPGLKCGIWFFHAHINETFSAEKETETAIYSPISPQQFNDGAFDKNWFFEAYNRLGEKRFRVLYKSAKYITAGSNQHRRSQLYADAVLGKLDARELMQEITEKRNQEKLRCYPLIPIAQGDHREALRRYEFIQKFLKESKQFGAQRKESEKKACATAMENLAITTGILDVNRLTWQMESQKIESIRPLMEPVVLEGVTLKLAIDDTGDAEIVMEKGGKPIKTAPKALAKNETYLELKATVKELKELKRRSRESLERAMTDCTAFGLTELETICGNPVLAPLLLKLVWTDGVINGFLQQTPDGLVLLRPNGECIAATSLRIAHPHDLKASGEWSVFMGLLYEQKLVQPFKQVFREYYPLTEDERQERTISRRYAGHQVQPQRTVALLRSRGWTVDYEEGLQKVFHRENLIVRMYALADWFSPADIEAPTLETVEFFDRGTQKNVPLEDVPPILFSETMRDLDLVVSVAHVGGVDPEASHSTVEMRVAIAAELAKLLKLSNVSWIGSHAKIKGKLASYSVHMGSGVVHAEGVGMVSILPVHSQSRGRIFLPFADDDPKTAEILSKILLLAEDEKTKDPLILSQICR